MLAAELNEAPGENASRLGVRSEDWEGPASRATANRYDGFDTWVAVLKVPEGRQAALAPVYVLLQIAELVEVLVRLHQWLYLRCVSHLSCPLTLMVPSSLTLEWASQYRKTRLPFRYPYRKNA